MRNSTKPSVQRKGGEGEFRLGNSFGDLPEPVLKAFEPIGITMNYPRGSAIFFEGDPASGVYMLCRGRAKMSTHSADGRALILRICGPGEWLGLSSAIADQPHEVTAEVVENCQINFIRRADFMRLIREYPEAGLSALRQLSVDYQQAHTQICSLGLSSSVSDKLAKLLIAWCMEKGSAAGGDPDDSPVVLKITFSHEDIAEMIGTSRETVTRLLKDFRERGLITIKGADLVVRSCRALEYSIGTHRRRAVL